MRIFFKVLPGLFMLIIIAVAIVALWRVSFVPSALPGRAYDKQALMNYNRCLALASSSGTPDAKVLARCGDELAKLPDLDDYTKARMDELRWMLTIIGSLAAFFAIAQSAAAYFSAQSYTKSADEAIDRIQNQEASVRARYPLFEEVERARDEAYTALRRDLKHVSKVEDDTAADPLEALVFIDRFYSGMPIEKRQNLLSVESFASIDLARNRISDEEYSNDLVRLAVFYESKFVYEDRLKRGNIADLERAETYLRLAFQNVSSNFTILNELGHLYIIFHRTFGSSVVDYLTKAEDEFNKSLNIEKKQQRAYYDLGVIKGKYRKDFRAAIGCLNEAKNLTNWQRVPVSYTSSFIFYNLGCYEAKELNRTLNVIAEDDAKNCLDALQRAAEYHCIPAEIITHDFSDADGDIHDAYAKADANLKKKLDENKAALLKPGPPKPREDKPTSFWAAVKREWKVRHPSSAA
jgi:hypothetical protein